MHDFGVTVQWHSLNASLCRNGNANQLKILIRHLMDVWREYKVGPASLSVMENTIFHGSVTSRYSEDVYAEDTQMHYFQRL